MLLLSNKIYSHTSFSECEDRRRTKNVKQQHTHENEREGGVQREKRKRKEQGVHGIFIFADVTHRLLPLSCNHVRNFAFLSYNLTARALDRISNHRNLVSDEQSEATFY